MILFYSLFIPILLGAILLYFYKHETIWWEPLIAIGSSLLFVFIFKISVEQSATSDTEYFGGVVIKAEYYEEWDEWIEQTCSSTCCCDSKGENCTTTYYDCSYRQYHGPEWIMTDNTGNTWSISEKFYNELKVRWGNKQSFVELNRDYYRMDGNKFEAYWDRKEQTAEITTTERDYENRVQASHTIINYQEVDTTEKRIYKLYDYKKVSGWVQTPIFGVAGKNYIAGLKKFDYLNGLLGQSKKMRCYVLLFNDVSEQAGYKQECYWKGGNKNEFIICIGLKKGVIQWTHIFSWTRAEEPKIKIRDFILLDNSQKVCLDLLSLSNFCFNTLQGEYEHRSFKEFSYLSVDPTGTQIIWCYIIILIINIGLGIFIIRNDLNNEE